MDTKTDHTSISEQARISAASARPFSLTIMTRSPGRISYSWRITVVSATTAANCAYVQVDQSRVVRDLTRKRRDDIADPGRKLGQDLLRLMSHCRLVHAGLSRAPSTPWIIGVVLKLSIGKPLPLFKTPI